MSANINVTLEELIPQSPDVLTEYDVSLPVIVKIENNETSSINVAGIKLVNDGGVAAEIVLGDFGMFNGVPSGSFGPSPSPMIVSGNMVIAAGETGSYLSAVTPKYDNGKENSIFTFTAYDLIAQVTLLSDPTVYTSSVFSFYGVDASPVGFECDTNTLVWNLRSNTRPINYNDFDAVVQTFALNPRGEPDYLAPWISFNNYSSSDTGIATVIQKGRYRSTTPSYTLTNSVGSVYGGQETQLIGGGGAVSFVGGTGVVTITNAIFPGVTGSVKILVQDSNPISLTVSPAVTNLARSTTLQAKAYLTYADGTVTDVTATATWSSSNQSAASVNSSTGVISAGSSVAGAVGQSTTVSATIVGLRSGMSVTIV